MRLTLALLGGLIACSPQVDPKIEAGRLLFQEGRRADGSIVTGKAYGDVALNGRQVSCSSCHGRSGMGAAETGTRTPPITSPMLFNPALRPKGPIYADATLALALRSGLDSGGEKLSPLMPRFDLSDQDVAALSAYLHTLSAEPPPGVGADEVEVATAFSDEVPAALRESVVQVIQALLNDHDADTRNRTGRNVSRLEGGRTRKEFRTWNLSTWILTGAPKTWPGQLQAHQAERPVFAMVGGRSTTTWAPVHGFCEAQHMPCLFPSVERSSVKDGDFYTLYFSDGLGVEARVMAAELLRAGAQATVVQVVGAGDAAAHEAAELLAAKVRDGGGTSQVLEPGDAALGPALATASAVVGWLSPSALEAVPAPPAGSYATLSGERLGPDWANAPLRWEGAHRVGARTASSAPDVGLLRFRAWAGKRGIAVVDEQIQAEAWFATMALLDGMEHIAVHPGRDYLLDTLDHATGMTALLPGYPQGELGPGQRILSKGAWVVDPGTSPRWVIP